MFYKKAKKDICRPTKLREFMASKPAQQRGSLGHMELIPDKSTDLLEMIKNTRKMF